jgi:hypothetical protein
VLSNLLSTVAPHHFSEPFVEPTANDFWVFCSTIEPTVNAIRSSNYYFIAFKPLH